jgi:hypothetical protein
MKKVALFAVLALIFFAGLVYSSGKYAEAKPIVEKMTISLEKFIANLERAENAGAVVSALDAYTNVMKELAPKAKALLKKYPELKDEKTHPEELKPLLKKMDELGKKMFGVLGKIQQFADDPQVKEANKRFMDTMAAMDPDQEEQKEEK